MRKIIKIQEGDPIPEGAKFLHKEEQKKYLGSYEKIISRGLIFDRVQEVHRYDHTVWFYYEVEVAE